MQWKQNDVIGNYRLVQDMSGVGGCSVVWKAVHLKTGAEFALKKPLSNPKYYVALENERKTWPKANHAYILPLVDAFEHNGEPVLVTPYASLGTLKDLIAKYTAGLPLEMVLQITDNILMGLEYLHQLHILHLDLKPANIALLSTNPQPIPVPQMMDFGLARILGWSEKTRLATGWGVGTMEYMAPEQFGDEDRPQQAYPTEIWALGVILYEMLCGRRPFQGPRALIPGNILSGKRDPLPTTVPEPFRKVVEKALQQDRKNRYQTAKEMREALLQARRDWEAAQSSPTVPTIDPVQFQILQKEVQQLTKDLATAKQNYQNAERQVKTLKEDARKRPYRTRWTPLVPITMLTVVSTFFASPYIYERIPFLKGMLPHSIATLVGSSQKPDPELAQRHSKRAQTFLLQGQLEQAAAECTEALRLNPQSAELQNQMGTVLYKQKQPTEAEKFYRRAVESDSKNARYRTNLAGALNQQGRYPEAEAAALEALRQNSSYADGYGELGLAQKAQGRLTEAEDSYAKAVRYESTDANYHLGYASILLKNGKTQEAKREAQKARALGIATHSIYGQLGL